MGTLARMPHRKWASWLMALFLFLVVATHYGLWTDNIDITSLTSSANSYLNDYPPHLDAAAAAAASSSNSNNNNNNNNNKTDVAAAPTAPAAPADPLAAVAAAVAPSACPQPAEPKKHLDLPADYDLTTEEDRLCETYYTDKYVYDIASSPRSLCATPGSSVTEFEVGTHPKHRKLAKATPVWLLQGVRWDPEHSVFVVQSDEQAKPPMVYGASALPVVRYDTNASGCLATTPDAAKREVVVYPALWEGTYPNMWHRLLEIWQVKHSFDAVSIALHPDTAKPFLTPEQIDYANVVLPSEAPGPWGDLWKIVTPSPQAALPPATLSPDTCYDVVIPTVGWASPFWSALLTSAYEFCPRQTLLTTFAARVMRHYGVAPRTPAAVATRPQQPTITVIQRATSRKFRDFDALLDKMHKRHPESPINVVDLALLSIKEQLTLALNTDVWVAHHGAAQTHLLFMPRTAAVVEILPPLFVSRGFRWIARMRGLVHFVGRAMWRVEYEEKYEGKPRPADWAPSRQDDSDANEWQTEEWVWITHDAILDLVDAAVASQRERINDVAS